VSFTNGDLHMAKNKSETPTLEERGISKIEVLHKAKRIDNDEFYTRY
jgi:hypothetical protein